MIRLTHRGRIGWSLTLATKRYHRTLWVDRPRLTKLCVCPCHAVIQPGLVPCPNCEHSSRSVALRKDA